MIKLLFFILALFSSGSAIAQQPNKPDPAFLQRALGVVQGQRNQALDAAAAADVRAAGLSDELAKAQARIKELEAKPEKKD